MQRLLALVLAACAGTFPTVSASAAPAGQDENLAAASLFARAEGRDVRVVVRITAEPGWYLYHGPTKADLGPGPEDELVGMPTTVELSGADVAWGDWRYSDPKQKEYDFGTPVVMNVHVGTLTLWRRGTLAEGASLTELSARIMGQTCEDSGTCVPYEEQVELAGPGPDAVFAAFPADLTATPKPRSAAPPDAARAPPGKSTSSASRGSANPGATGAGDEVGLEASLFAFLLSAVFWGLFTLLMPCTYPMIPITISYFTKQADQRRTGTLSLSLAYGAGIVLIFVLIGVLVGPIVIAFAAHPVTNIVIGLLFLVFALTLFGVMTLQPPAFLMGMAGTASQKGGYIGVFLMGATLVVTSFTCTAPFVGALLGQGAGQGGVGRIALGMAVFGLTIAVPFVFLSMVPGKVKAMPKSGEWMHTLKVWLGFVEVAAAIKFVSNADLVWNWGWLSRENFLWLWAGTFFAAAAYLFAWIRLKDEYGSEESSAVSPRRMVWGFATLLFAVYCGYGALGNKVDPILTAMAPPYSNALHVGAGAGESAGPQTHAIVKDDYDAAVERARREGKQLLVNFTGFTCINCRLMEENVFPLPAVRDALARGFVEARLHTDGGPAEARNKELQRELTGSVANPIYVVVDPRSGTALRKKAGFAKEETFLQFLRGPVN
ncbi:MAG: thioredoxin family protein [Planctomycetes bacterium]|nr:thioredoxin family protein [Planctomycetota bacterium]